MTAEQYQYDMLLNALVSGLKSDLIRPGLFKLGVATPNGSQKGSMGVTRCFKNIIKVFSRKHFKQMRQSAISDFY